MKPEKSQNNAVHIRPDLKVGKLAKLAFETYFDFPDRQAQEIARMQDGEYCNRTFNMKAALPVLKRVDEIVRAPAGTRVGERAFLHEHYWVKEYLIDGVKYRIVNDWHEPPNPRDNRTPLKDWIRRMGLAL